MIDALDECRDSDGTRSQFLTKLRDLQARGDVRLLATSRFVPEIVDEFRGALKLEVRASNEDVKCFVVGQIYRLPKCIAVRSCAARISPRKDRSGDRWHVGLLTSSA